jgi:hypothetical protein
MGKKSPPGEGRAFCSAWFQTGFLRIENGGRGGGHMVAEPKIVRVIQAMIQENIVFVLFVGAIVVVGRIGGNHVTTGGDIGIHLIYDFHYVGLDVMLFLEAYIFIHISRILSAKSHVFINGKNG